MQKAVVVLAVALVGCGATKPRPAGPSAWASGDLAGSAFTPTLVQMRGPAPGYVGRVSLRLFRGTGCDMDAKEGDVDLLFAVPWGPGARTDLGTLSSKGVNPEAQATRHFDSEHGKGLRFRPQGALTIVSAPSQKGAIGKITIDLRSGDYVLTGDMPVIVRSPDVSR
jgi:hypothetical protein